VDFFDGVPKIENLFFSEIVIRKNDQFMLIVKTIQNSPDSSGMVACRGNPLWLPGLKRRQATIRTDSGPKRNDEALYLSLQIKKMSLEFKKQYWGLWLRVVF